MHFQSSPRSRRTRVAEEETRLAPLLVATFDSSHQSISCCDDDVAYVFSLLQIILEVNPGLNPATNPGDRAENMYDKSEQSN